MLSPPYYRRYVRRETEQTAVAKKYAMFGSESGRGPVLVNQGQDDFDRLTELSLIGQIEFEIYI